MTARGNNHHNGLTSSGARVVPSRVLLVQMRSDMGSTDASLAVEGLRATAVVVEMCLATVALEVILRFKPDCVLLHVNAPEPFLEGASLPLNRRR